MVIVTNFINLHSLAPLPTCLSWSSRVPRDDQSAGTIRHAKREATTKRGCTRERWRRVDAERGFRSAGDVETRGPGCGRQRCYAASRHSYRWCSPPTRGSARTFAVGDGGGVTALSFGASLARLKWQRSCVVVSDVHAHESDKMPFAEYDHVFEHVSASGPDSSVQRCRLARDCDRRCDEVSCPWPLCTRPPHG